MKRSIKILYASVIVGMSAMGVLFFLSKMPTVPRKQFKKLCHELAELDAKISRAELEGNFLSETEVQFPSEKELIQQRYRLFFELYRKYTLEDILEEKRKLEKRWMEFQK